MKSLDTKKQKVEGKIPNRAVLVWQKLVDAYAASCGNSTLHPATQRMRRSMPKGKCELWGEGGGSKFKALANTAINSQVL